MLRLISKRWVQVMLLLLLLAGLVYLRLNDPATIKHWRQLTFDKYNQLMPRLPGHSVAIIDIDEESLKRYGQWPWPRPLIGEIPVLLKKMGAKAVAFDMVFAEKDRTSPQEIAKNLKDVPNLDTAREILQALPDNDEVFAKKIAEAGNVITGFVAATGVTNTNVTIKQDMKRDMFSPEPNQFLSPAPLYYTNSLPVIVKAASGNGNFTPPAEEDSVIRRILAVGGCYDEDKKLQRCPALSLEALRVAQGPDAAYAINTYSPNEGGSGIKSITVGNYTIPTEKDGTFRIYYSKNSKTPNNPNGSRKDFYIPAWKLLEDKGQVSDKEIMNKIIFVGTSAVGLLDLRSSALGEVLSGSQAHAEAIEQILNKKFLKRPEYFNGSEILVMCAVSLMIIFIAPFIGAGTLALLGVVAIGSGVMGALYAFRRYGLLLDPVYPSLSVIIIFILSSILTNLRSELERRAVKNAFGYYISPALMEELASDPEKLKLGGEVRELSVMFTDIRNFTTISESMDPAELIKMMNDFLTPMTSCVLDNRGTIDKYMGDAMMAFWNAPLDDPDHAIHACTAALQMLAGLKTVNENLKQAGKTIELKAGIGIHTGKCSVGNMGSKQRFAYSALGDTVNLASRLEGQTKGYGISVMISEEVRRKAPGFAAVEIDLLTVKGRKEPERVYTLLGDAVMATSGPFQAFVTLHQQMLAAYRGQQWGAALALSEQCAVLRPDIAGLYALYRQRIEDFKTNPPPAGWQGVWIAKEKS
jgi:adenylate cyclase